MQVREVRTWTTEELQRRLGEAQRELFTLRRELAMGRLEDHTRIRAVKRDVAQIQTILRERELVAGGARRQYSE
jgi:large subunit ribosomal protein L29